jgi:hypothetical protein
MQFTVKWNGTQQAVRFFNSLTVFQQNAFWQSVNRDASKPVKEQAIANAPLGPAKQRARAKVARKPLKEGIKTVSGGSIRKTGIVGLVRTGALRRNPYRAFHANFLEQFNFRITNRPAGGWYKKINPNGKTSMPRIPFMAKAIASKGSQTEKLVATSFDRKMTQLMKRYLKKGKQLP